MFHNSFRILPSQFKLHFLYSSWCKFSSFGNSSIKAKKAPVVKPRQPHLQQFAISACNQFEPLDAQVFESGRSLEFRWPTTSDSIRKLISSTFNTNSKPLRKSPWDKSTHRLSLVLWPNVKLEAERKQPVFSPWKPVVNKSTASDHESHESHKRKQSVKKQSLVDNTPAEISQSGEYLDGVSNKLNSTKHLTLEQIALNNIQRLDTLWELTTSHGFSWNRVDELYMLFMDRYHECLKKIRIAEPELRQEAARIAHEIVTKSRRLELESIGVDISRIPDRSPVRCPRSQFRTAAKLIFYQWKRAYLSPFLPGSLIAILRAEATKAVLEREAHERCLNLPSIRVPNDDVPNDDVPNDDVPNDDVPNDDNLDHH